MIDALPADLGNRLLLCQVELGLRLLERLDASVPVTGAWTLFSGYPFARARGLAEGPDSEWMLNCARHRLWPLRRRRFWTMALHTYATVPQRFRAYRIDVDSGHAKRIEPTVLPHRFDVYDDALTSLPGFSTVKPVWAKPGTYRLFDRRRLTSVHVPGELCSDDVPVGHDLATPTTTNGSPVDIPLCELATVARWMDEKEEELGLGSGSWVKRLAALRLDRRTPGGDDFRAHDVLRLDRLLHLVGMVGAGKSTLMTLVAVWAVRQGMHITLVVGDVAEQLRLTTLFRDLLGEHTAAPILGNTTREQHAQRLHRRLAARGAPSLFDHHDEPAFDELGTACPLDGLRDSRPALPLRFIDAPCNALYGEKPAPSLATSGAELPYSRRHRRLSPQEEDQDEDLGPVRCCPLWNRCPRHQPSRTAVDAPIWIANPASLVQSPVPKQLNPESLRQLELACLRSDIVIVDEADRVMMNLDTMFAPSATLVSKGPESWLDQLHTHKIHELAREGRLQLSEPDVVRWEAALTVVSGATNRIYQMLISDADLRHWVDIDNFSSLSLQGKLLAEWYPAPETSTQDTVACEEEVYEYDDPGDLDDPDVRMPECAPWDERRAEVRALLDRFADDPLGDHGPYGDDAEKLVAAIHDLLNTYNQRGTRRRVHTVLELLLEGSPVARDADWSDRAAKRLEFSLLVAALEQRLDRLTYLWPQVEASLRLDPVNNELVRRPPLDYAPLVPESPMGNVLGFQYLPDERASAADPQGRVTGTLRFFRCAGVGRELLLSLPDIGGDRALSRSGPHVLLMSGTSWAGTSTRAHVLAPVGAVLKPAEEALDAVRKTVFSTCFLYDRHHKPISLSGQDPSTRPAVLREMIDKLARRKPSGEQAPLESELGRVRDPDRRRALLLVGSYREARAAAEQLNDMSRWAGRVRLLIADDAELEHALSGAVSEPAPLVGTLRRGDVESLADDDEAEVLVAPLMAVERGHNILNNKRQAAFGTVLFLARPHPRPDDLSLSIFAINDWVTRLVRGRRAPDSRTRSAFDDLVTGASDLDHAGRVFRREARAEWGRLLARRYSYSALTTAERRSFAWDQLVTIWQVIGRLVRGGVPARVVFVDAKFAPRAAAAMAPVPARSRRADTARSSLLVNLREILAPYFDSSADRTEFADPADAVLVRMLYQPLYDALCGMKELR
ncbi:hypothetical protein [Lentzea flaviverrucosa]|uniref:pPIWI-RE three-gene island domain-containing protein n=1 Tax=Lentzea flaviverrucosa TaxID=200379 RepID=A0A1H9WRR2_9PSEU|nr:hypothetical protein [Lentzea flaviverrucosa]RDI23044.1 hypothetical protein DFR72_111175 [Lentzea flaviverrucosa]SES36626.1 hypothetical protein SAMN05216195_112170 [Lentzea flaviverrucosa]